MSPPPAAAQAAPASPDVVVIASPLAADAGQREETVATAEQLRAMHAADLTDFLKRMTGGVFVNEVQGNPLQPDLSYHGYTASPLLGTPEGLSVYVDGVRLNQPFGDIVSWDLIPKSAIRSVSLVRGGDPLFGRNTLGGALDLRTKDGRSDPGYGLEATASSFRRRTLAAEAGGASGRVDWFGSADLFDERGWRDASPSRAAQLFGKLGWSDAATEAHLSASYADTALNGNGLQEMRLLAADRSGVYTQPDNTRNRAGLVNLTARHLFSAALTLSGSLFARIIRTRTENGDVNTDALGGDPYTLDATERVALAATNYAVPSQPETQANTPFPRLRCIADVLLDTAPNGTCDGLVNRSATRQREWGGATELTLATGRNVLTLGFSLSEAVSDFAQSSQFGYLTPDRGVTTVEGPGALADGGQASPDAFDARVDLRARTGAWSVYAADALDLSRGLRLDTSVRYDRATVLDRDRITPGGGAGSLDADLAFTRLNPAVALRWSPTAAWSVDARLAETSRAPSAVELGCADPDNPCRLPNALAGDPPLRQVVARTAELGVQRTWKALTIRLDAFHADNRNDILFVADDPSGAGYFRNVGRTRRQGVDLDLTAHVGSRLILAGHYTFLDATYQSPAIVDGSANSSSNAPAPGFDGEIAITPGDRIPLIPRHLFKASADWRPADRLSINLDMLAQSGVIARGNENGAHRPDDIYYLGPGTTAAYAVVNAGIEWRPARRLALFLQTDNLLDAAYSTAAQLGVTALDSGGRFVARPFAGPVIGGERPLLSSTFYAPGAPRSVTAGIRVRL